MRTNFLPAAASAPRAGDSPALLGRRRQPVVPPRGGAGRPLRGGAPEHYGSEAPGRGPASMPSRWPTRAPSDRADRRERRKVHLVGHSYGGGVALNIALARPHRVASMALYEPSRSICCGSWASLAKWPSRKSQVSPGMCRGRRHRRLSGSRCRLRRLLERAGCLEGFAPAGAERADPVGAQGTARLSRADRDQTPAEAYHALTFPVLILRGEHAPTPTRLIAEGLSNCCLRAGSSPLMALATWAR